MSVVISKAEVVATNCSDSIDRGGLQAPTDAQQYGHDSAEGWVSGYCFRLTALTLLACVSCRLLCPRVPLW